MKDCHDLLVMIREPDFLDIGKLVTSIQATADYMLDGEFGEFGEF